MPRTYKSKNARLNYSNDSMLNAICLVKQGTPLSTAAHRFSVPRNTLRRHVKNETIRPGGKTIFTYQQEKILCKRILYAAERGFPMTISNIRFAAYEYAHTLDRRRKLNSSVPNNWQKNKRASLDWWESFRKRNPDLSLRKPEGLSAARAQAFNKERVDSYFNDLRELFDLLNLRDFPQLVYNTDETGISTVPNNPSKVIAQKGARSVQAVRTGERGTLTTIIPTVSASGDILPPFVICKGGNVKMTVRNIYETHNIGVASTKSGYNDSETFVRYLNHFDRHRTKIPGKKCVLLLDGHASHVSIEAIDFCINHDIELVCIPPHSSHRLQPLDTHFNAVLKRAWCKALENFLNESGVSAITTENFASLFCAVFKEIEKKRGLVVDAFAHCGIYPLQNTISDHELSVSKSFLSEVESKMEIDSVKPCDVQDNNSEAILIRSIICSPKKTLNPTHTKVHKIHITSPEIREKKLIVRMRFDQKKKPLCRLINDGQQSPCTSRDIEDSILQPSTSKSPKKDSTKQTKRKLDNKEHQCCCCDAAWEETTEDWMKCESCNKWCCESCFGTFHCYKCAVKFM